MKALLLAVLAVQLLGAAHAQDHPLDPPRQASILDVAHAAGQPEAFFNATLGVHVLASFYYGLNYDLTYLIDGGLLTVAFFEGRAGSFRLITRRARATAEAMPLMLGVDTAGLQLIDERDVKKVWTGRLRGVRLQEVAAVTGPDGWHMVMIKIAGYPHD